MEIVYNWQCQLEHKIDLLGRDSTELTADLDRYTKYQAERQGNFNCLIINFNIYRVGGDILLLGYIR